MNLFRKCPYCLKRHFGKCQRYKELAQQVAEYLGEPENSPLVKQSVERGWHEFHFPPPAPPDFMEKMRAEAKEMGLSND